LNRGAFDMDYFPINRRSLLKWGSACVTGTTVGTNPVRAQDGTDDPIEIEDWNDLNAIRDDVNENYILLNNLDKDTAGYDDYVRTPNMGFEPIGGSFSGSLDGQNHSIADLVINRPDASGVGLFAEIRSGSIERLHFKNVNITAEGGGLDGIGGISGSLDGKIADCSLTGEVVGSESVGGMVGRLREGEIINCSINVELNGDEDVGGVTGKNSEGIIQDIETDVNITGVTTPGGLKHSGGVVGNNTATVKRVVSSGSITGFRYVGGLIGTNGGLVTNSSADVEVEGEEDVGGAVGRLGSGRMTEVYANGSVTGFKDIGGLVGSSGAFITNSFANVEVEGDEGIGGAVGNLISGRITNIYATGRVAGFREVGGLVGCASTSTIIQRCYSTGEVTGEFDVGGLIGDQLLDAAEVDNSYWDIIESGLDESDGGRGLSTAEMQGEAAVANMDEFDFEETWDVVTDPSGYPILAWQEPDRNDDTNVELYNVEFSPEKVSDSDRTHELTFVVSNLSNDGEPDKFSIAVPGEVEVEDAKIQESGGFDMDNPLAKNPIEFVVNPEPDAPTEAEFEIELKLSPDIE
jgi:hypothetical protein